MHPLAIFAAVTPAPATEAAGLSINFFWVIVAALNFLLFLAIIWRFGFDPIAKILAQRKARIDQGLADYPDGACDYVILSQTLQESHRPRKVLREMLRVGRRVIVAFPNFGHWRVRLSMLVSGGAPRTKLFPYEWYESPNIHFLTVLDFEALAGVEGLVVERRYFLAGRRKVTLLPNLLAEVAVFLVSAAG